MTGKTHRLGGMLCSLIGFSVLKSKGMLLPDVNNLIQLAVIYPYGVWASTASDLDQNPESSPSKDVISSCINKALHLTTKRYQYLDEKLDYKKKKYSIEYKVSKLLSANHRSWQTHSFEVLLLIIYLTILSMKGAIFIGLGSTDYAILSLIFTGISFGLIAHYALDMLTPEGIWCLTFVAINKALSLVYHRHIEVLPKKVHLVPYAEFFCTDGTWERIIRFILKTITPIYLLYFVLSTYTPNVWHSIYNVLSVLFK